MLLPFELPSALFAREAVTAPENIVEAAVAVADKFSSADTIWVLLGAALVFFMQAGFAAVEAGFTRAKNTGNIVMKNLMDFSLGTFFFWFVGYGVMFGAASAYFGGFDFFMQDAFQGKGWENSFPIPAFLIFQTVFCATAATIVSGAMAERTKFAAYCIYSVLISAVVYPISGHWTWGGGWLSEVGNNLFGEGFETATGGAGFHDFAGSSIVHMVGGIAAFIGAATLGPRIGKYTKDGKPKAILGSNLALGALGVFILWFGWFGFNGASTTCASGDDTLISMGNIFVTTNMAAAVAAAVVMIVTWLRYGKPDVSMTLNGALAGLVGITAGCDAVSPAGAAIIGLICGIALVFAIEFIDKVLKVDDPVGAIAVHGVCGAIGTILVGVLALNGGLVYGGGANFLIVQLIGVASIGIWVVVMMLVVFNVIKYTIGLRVSATEEIEGLDITEHGLASSYADFTLNDQLLGVTAHDEGKVPVSQAISVARKTVSAPAATVASPKAVDPNRPKISKITMIFRQSKFEELKKALGDIEVTGMTVTQVMGCGMQKGSSEYYRGVPIDIQLLPKVRVEVIVCKVPVDLVVETAKKVLYTGNIGDGKIFVYDVENVVKVRTGEEGYAALQDE
jgi:Amt family ammonium transporter